MDWRSSAMGDMYPQYINPDEEMQEEDNEDFYGDEATNGEDTQPGASNQQYHDASDLLNSFDTMVNGNEHDNERDNEHDDEHDDEHESETELEQEPSKSEDELAEEAKAEALLAEERKAENQRKANLLRAKLIAQRQNTNMSTPIKAVSRANTPAKAPVVHAQVQPASSAAKDQVPEMESSSSDALGLDALLAEGRAAAAAKASQQQAPSIANVVDSPTVNATNGAPQREPRPATNIQDIPQPKLDTTETTLRPTVLSNVYYADLSAWLEITGYHDVAFRSSKLEKYKERRALEEEAARINERIEKLRREEAMEMEALRNLNVHLSSTQHAIPPPLPSSVPSADIATMAAVANKLTNGVKRAHSPPPSDRVNRRRDDATPGFRIRGANDSPSDGRPLGRRASPPQTERRISYPDARRRSIDTPRTRDPSLERRQAYYNRDGDRLPPPGNGFPGPRYDARDTRETPRNYKNNRGGNGSSFSAGRPAYRDQQGGGSTYRGTGGLDLPKAGQQGVGRRV